MIYSRTEIQTIIPHREPFIFVDQVDEVQPGVFARGVARDFLAYELFANLGRIGHGASYLVRTAEASDGGYAARIPSVGKFGNLFIGHFPGHPVFPGALTLEAVAETGVAALKHSWGDDHVAPLLTSIDRWRFRLPVWPEDPLELRVAPLECDEQSAKFFGQALVGGRVAAQGELGFAKQTVSATAANAMPGPVFPISLLVEALAEVGAVLALNSDENRGKIIFLAGIEGWRTHRPIEPGAELHMEAKLVARRHTYGKGHVLATQNGNPVAEGDLMFMLRADTQEGTAEQAMAVGA